MSSDSTMSRLAILGKANVGAARLNNDRS